MSDFTDSYITTTRTAITECSAVSKVMMQSFCELIFFAEPFCFSSSLYLYLLYIIFIFIIIIFNNVITTSAFKIPCVYQPEQKRQTYGLLFQL